jgi:hypothetical protein
MTPTSTLSRLSIWLPLGMALLFISLFLGVGWLPWDDGMLGQTALRVLQGEIPHRDFVDPYTGLLTLGNAAIFRIFGVDLIYLRWPLFAACVVFTFCLYRLFLLFLSPPSAAWATAGSLMATVPNYFVALPSWYLLFTSGAAFFLIVRWIQTDRAFLLFGAGVLLGIATEIKINALFFTYGAVLSVLFATSIIFQPAERHDPSNPTQSLSFWALSLAAIAGIAGIGLLISPRLSLGTIYLFFLPVISVCGASAFWWYRHGAPSIKILCKKVLPLLLGFVLVWVPFLLYFGIYGDIRLWLYGVFVSPQARFSTAAVSPPDLILIFLPLIFFIRRFSRRDIKIISIILGIVMIALVSIEPRWGEEQFSTYPKILWPLMLGIIPWIIARACWIVLDLRNQPNRQPHERAYLFAICCWAAFWNLNQYPYTGSGYLLYSVIPILVTIAAISRDTLWGTRPIAIIQWGSATVAMMLGVLPRITPLLPLREPGRDLHIPLAMKGASILVSREDFDRYHWLIPEVQKRAGNGAVVAFPEQPHIYFLAEKKNITPILYELLGSPGRAEADLITPIKDDRVRAVVTWIATLEDPGAAYLDTILRERFPNRVTGHEMVVLWR